MGLWHGEHREWEWFLQWLLAGQLVAQWSPQTYMKVETQGFQHLDCFLIFHLWWQPHGKCQLLFCQWLQHILWNSITSVPHLRDSKSQANEPEAEHTGKPVCTESQKEITAIWTYLKGWKKPSLFYSLSLFTWAQFSLQHCAGEAQAHQKNCCSRPEHQCQQSQGLIQNTSFETCCYKVQVWDWNKRGLREHLPAVPEEMKCYCPLRLSLSVFCCSSTIITPPSAVLLCLSLIRPGVSLPAVSDFALPHNTQELILPDLNGPYSTDQSYKKTVHFPPQSKRKAWREEILPVFLYTDSFHTFLLKAP